MASQTTCSCCVEMPCPFRNERAALAPSTSKRFSAVWRSVKPRSCRIAATAKSSASGATTAASESKMPNNQERITWLKRNGSNKRRDKSIASRTSAVSGTLIPAKSMFVLPHRQTAGCGLRGLLTRGNIEQFLYLGVQFPSDLQSIQVFVWLQKADHSVVGQMHAIGPLIDENGDRRI